METFGETSSRPDSKLFRVTHSGHDYDDGRSPIIGGGRRGDDVMRRQIFAAKTRILMRATRRAHAEMLRNESLPAERSIRLTDERSAAMALHAFDSSPFYRDRYLAAGFGRDDVARPENFVQLPILTKDDIRDAGDRIAARSIPPRRALPSSTGGSTGSPLRVANDAAAPTAAMWWRMYSWWGIHPSDHVGFAYRRLHTGSAAALRALQWWPTRHLQLDARMITDASIDEFLRAWRRIRPALLVGYVEAVTALAERIQEAGLDLPMPKAVSVTASVLHPGQRELIERVLGAPVFDTYRSAEVPWIAAECTAHQGLHVPSDQRRVEIIDDQVRPLDRDPGSVLVTDLSNFVFPLIRYAIGDRAARLPDPCPCGRTLPRITPIQGRQADVLRTPTGRRVTGGLSGLFLGHPGLIRQLQVVQSADFSVEIRYVKEPGADASLAAATAVDRLIRLTSGEVRVRAVEVADVQRDGGKARLVIAPSSYRAADASSDSRGSTVL